MIKIWTGYNYCSIKHLLFDGLTWSEELFLRKPDLARATVTKVKPDAWPQAPVSGGTIEECIATQDLFITIPVVEISKPDS